MNKEEYIKLVNSKLNGNSKEIILKQINNYFKAKELPVPKCNYKIGDDVYLKKGTLLHGTYKNIEGLEEIVKNGLVSSWFIDGRGTKYPSSVGVWNLKQDYKLKDYINFYSGGTIEYFNHLDSNKETEVISYSDIPNFMSKIIEKDYLVWNMQQTKEARFMPSLVQKKVQIGIIFNSSLASKSNLLAGDILETNNVNDKDVQPFVNNHYYEQFIIDRKNKDDFFTDRESAILFGIPSNFIEGILVGRTYEKNSKILEKIKELLPNCYICNLDGKVIL